MLVLARHPLTSATKWFDQWCYVEWILNPNTSERRVFLSLNFHKNDEEQTKPQMATMGQKMKNLLSELQEHRVNAVKGNPRTVDPNQKTRRNATRFCNYCRTNGHTPSWCRMKIREEELKLVENSRERSHFYSGIHQKMGTRSWIRTMDQRPTFPKMEPEVQ